MSGAECSASILSSKSVHMCRFLILDGQMKDGRWRFGSWVVGGFFGVFSGGPCAYFMHVEFLTFLALFLFSFRVRLGSNLDPKGGIFGQC